MGNPAKALWFGLSFFMLALSSRAADDLYSSQIVDQARQWQQKNRDDQASSLWRKLLIFDPKHPEALIKLGIIQARAGNLTEAEALLHRALQLSPAPNRLQELSDAVRAAKGTAPEMALSMPRETSRPPEPLAVKSAQEAPVASKSASKPGSKTPSKAVETPAKPSRAELPDNKLAKQPAVGVQKPAETVVTPVRVEPSTGKSTSSRPKEPNKAAEAKLPASKMPSAKPAASSDPTLKATETRTPISAAETELNFSTSLDPVQAKPRP